MEDFRTLIASFRSCNRDAMSFLTKMQKMKADLSNESSHRKRVGGMWTEIGSLQFQFMASQGLLPEHKLLDVGCGCLRGGIHFIKFLENGHYFGIDKDQKLLDLGLKEELPEAQLQSLDVHLL